MVSMAIAIISMQKRFAAHRSPMPAHDGFLLKPALIVSHTWGVCNLSSQGSTSFRVLRLFTGAFLPSGSKYLSFAFLALQRHYKWVAGNCTCSMQDQVPDKSLCINFSDTDIQRTWMGKAGKSNNWATRLSDSHILSVQLQKHTPQAWPPSCWACSIT